ncbi:hypothetical protein [Parapedobacter koreensis]|uniref:DUF4386 domain-containing protein n=1 Tax=Parapedobacter koreensis TaxID=332977 RepID=A0A1H7PB68_9SPHI|nr:hypothetical protein [Parapedobacter koreensis]SEL32515.1 hypothetical protein SAMN05421740_104270 [Parapedobacter koreensis]
MEYAFRKTTGISLVVGSLLMVLTMILHPSGGSMEYILKIRPILITSHSIAILSLPFITFGFYGLSIALLTEDKISMLSFIISCFGIIAAMIAALINGLTLPLFLSGISTDTVDQKVVNTVRTYGNYINIPMGYILLAAFTLAIGIWSGLIIRSSVFPNWIGYLGLAVVFPCISGLFFPYDFLGLFGFRIVVLGIVTWIITTDTFIIFTEIKTFRWKHNG